VCSFGTMAIGKYFEFDVSVSGFEFDMSVWGGLAWLNIKY